MMSTPSCDECTNSLDRVAKGIATEEAIQEAITFLKGSGFCDITSDAETCAYMMDQYIPKVVPILSVDINHVQAKLLYFLGEQCLLLVYPQKKCFNKLLYND